MKWLGVTRNSSFCTPGGSHRSVCILNQIQYVLYITFHVSHRQAFLAGTAYSPCSPRILTTYTRCYNRQWFRTDIFTKPEILVKTKTNTLVIRPDVSLLLPGFNRTYSVFPAINIIEAISMYKAPARETHKFGVKLCNGLCK